MSHNLFYFQAEEHPLHLQHHPGGVYLAHIHRPIPDGQKHLVLCGEPLLQIPVLLQSFFDHEIMTEGCGSGLRGGATKEMKRRLAVDGERCLCSKCLEKEKKR